MTKSEMVLSKTFSAQWLMSVITTAGATLITAVIVWKRPEFAQIVLGAYFMNWGNIINSYFKRDRAQDSTNTSTVAVSTPKKETAAQP